MADSFAALKVAYLAIQPQRFQAIERGRISNGTYDEKGEPAA
jgi:hypothetical protein